MNNKGIMNKENHEQKFKISLYGVNLKA